MDVPLHQKTYLHSPQTKVLEFLLAVLAGLPHLEDMGQDGRLLDQDRCTLAYAWQQAAWADYSGVGRTLQTLTQAEAEAIASVLAAISRPLIDEQVTQVLAQEGRLIYDGDLTGRPVSNTSTTYPEAAFGHIDDEVRLGYQAALVSLRSPVYTLVRVAAHTPAGIEWVPGGCWLRFSDESVYAGRVIQTGGWAFQFSLPLFQNFNCEPFSTNPGLIAQPFR